MDADATERVPPCVHLTNSGSTKPMVLAFARQRLPIIHQPLRRQKEGEIKDKRVAFADIADIKARYRGLEVIGYDALLS